MCKALKVSRSIYYRWYTTGPSKHVLEESMYADLISDIHKQSRYTYGSPRIREELKRKGYCISRRRVANIMRKNGWRSCRKRRFRITTDSNHPYPVSRNLLEHDFQTNRLNEVWVSDITYIQTEQGWLYLTTVLDLYDRQVIGWSLSGSLHTQQTILPAWKMAASKRKITEQLIFHSDRGIQYASEAFRTLLKKNTLIKQSMSRKADCWDNAVAESFFGTLKVELIYRERFETIEQAKDAVFEYIEIWYNRKRLHSSLGYKTPVEMESEFMNKQNAA